MRELYAVQLAPDTDAAGADRAIELISRWATNPFPELDWTALLAAGDFATTTGSIRVGRTNDAAWVLRWQFRNEADASLTWLVECAVSAPAEPLCITLRIRIGQNGLSAPVVGPLAYEFRSPAIIRTLTREFEVLDAGARISPEPGLIGASAVGGLVEFLTDGRRRLPVILLSADSATGRPLVDASELARQLAGVAHVRVLTSGLAGRNLTEAIGPQLSAWWGAVRIYWPGFQIGDDPYAHRLWLPDRIREQRVPLVAELSRWLGSLSSARTPHHPAVRALMTAQQGDIPAWIHEYVEDLERSNSNLTAEVESLGEVNIRLHEELEALRRNWALMPAAGRMIASARSEADTESPPPRTVREAFDRATSLTGDRCVLLESARRSAYAFEGYNDPEKLLRAVLHVAEASALYGKGALGMSLSQWFRDRGYEYSSRNPAAHARPTRDSYRITYQGAEVAMEPHLKVDQSTSPDQCLRIYWYVDEVERVFVVGHVGRHLE